VTVVAGVSMPMSGGSDIVMGMSEAPGPRPPLPHMDFPEGLYQSPPIFDSTGEPVKKLTPMEDVEIPCKMM